jgi:LacI family transcriptional regulator
VSRARLDGFRSVLAAHAIDAPDDLVRHGAFRVDEAAAGCRALLARDDPPTALFVANNLMLIGVMQALAAAGVPVPAVMSVASIDDFPWASAFQPALTVVRQPIAQMAKAALDALVARMSGDDAPPRRRVFAPELVIRASCAAPRC